jgi:hypothetical protein
MAINKPTVIYWHWRSGDFSRDMIMTYLSESLVEYFNLIYMLAFFIVASVCLAMSKTAANGCHGFGWVFSALPTDWALGLFT